MYTHIDVYIVVFSLLKIPYFESQINIQQEHNFNI